VLTVPTDTVTPDTLKVTPVTLTDIPDMLKDIPDMPMVMPVTVKLHMLMMLLEEASSTMLLTPESLMPSEDLKFLLIPTPHTVVTQDMVLITGITTHNTIHGLEDIKDINMVTNMEDMVLMDTPVLTDVDTVMVVTHGGETPPPKPNLKKKLIEVQFIGFDFPYSIFENKINFRNYRNF